MGDYRNQVRITRSNYQVRILGCWWRIAGRYDVGIPGVCVVGPVRRRDIGKWVDHVIQRAEGGRDG